MASTTLAWKHWTRVISRWPIDKVRPEAVSFQTLMKKRLEAYENPARAAEAVSKNGNQVNVQPANLSWNEVNQTKQVNALYALLEDRFATESPLPQKLRNPTSSPHHYDNIVAESERAPSRSMMTKISEKLRGMVRLK